MKYLMRSLLGVVILATYSCSSTGNGELDTDSISKEISARMDAFVTSNNAMDLNALKDFYSNDESFYWVEDGKIQYANKQVLETSLSGLVGMVSGVDMKILDQRIEVISEDSALAFLEYEQAMTMSSGGAFNINGAMTVLLKKEERVWRFLFGHSSTKKER
ncbi:nuclear transport factor 2 family protein [Roseivirga sp.]|uniref:nuclear transport factor 2 family protein n=1 Tax=Roseivirga sp. TaxID=1964215 RepID=UPI003B8E043E